jgi:hypothetical protein
MFHGPHLHASCPSKNELFCLLLLYLLAEPEGKGIREEWEDVDVTQAGWYAGPRSPLSPLAGSVVFSSTLDIQRELVTRTMAKSKLCGSGMLCAHYTTAD